MKRYRDIAGDAGSNILGQVAEKQQRLAARLRGVKRTVAVMSGKGGVGKSAVTANLAAALASRGQTVGVLDADLNGPSIAQMLGVRGHPLRFREGALQPAVGPAGIRVLSMDLFLPKDEAPLLWKAPTQRDSFVWRATQEVSAIREFLTDTLWGELDFLFLDLPPGTDSMPTVLGLFPEGAGALIVTIPSAVSQLVVRKSVTMAREVLSLPVVGLLENMGVYVCTRCGASDHLFHDGGSERMAREMRIPFLGSIPFDARISACGDRGVPFVVEHGHSPTGKVFAAVAARLEEHLG
jgi:ATP-binding protein involved in chromosome partitioning